VLIAGGEREWKGSGRSIPAFDLHAGLGACAAHLERFGGHRAAAGLAILPESIEAFAEAFAEHAAPLLSEDDLRRVVRIDAVVPRGVPLTLGLCQELARLAPFGLGNPNVTLLAPACGLGELAAVGDGKHLRFRVRTEAGVDGGSAIGFGMGRELDHFRRPGLYDVAFRLQENRWNGTVAPQLVVQRVFDTPERYSQVRTWLEAEYRKEEGRDPLADEVFAELELDGGIRRSLLESERFRELLVDVPLPRAA
jgi:single-stranded-DNA-specific exonuclease